jgi:hypothetical protein
MSTKVIIGIIAAILIVSGGAWYLSQGKAGMGDTNTEVVESSQGAGTFADLLSQAGSRTCTVKTFIEEAPSTGTVYIANGKIRGDFVSMPEAMGSAEVTSHMIQADGYVYTWTDMMPQGMKMKMPEASAQGQTTTQGSVPADTRVEYSCSLWITDDTKFEPPAEVSFMEFGGGGLPTMPPPMPI